MSYWVVDYWVNKLDLNYLSFGRLILVEVYCTTELVGSIVALVWVVTLHPTNREWVMP